MLQYFYDMRILKIFGKIIYLYVTFIEGFKNIFMLLGLRLFAFKIPKILMSEGCILYQACDSRDKLQYQCHDKS